jgi:hypothetical protein
MAKKQIFEASHLAGQPGKPLHTAEGIVRIAYTSSGDSSVKILVYGILFNPIKPESGDYSFKVTPEFPFASSILAAIIGIVLAAAAASNAKKVIPVFSHKLDIFFKARNLKFELYSCPICHMIRNLSIFNLN